MFQQITNLCNNVAGNKQSTSHDLIILLLNSLPNTVFYFYLLFLPLIIISFLHYLVFQYY